MVVKNQWQQTICNWMQPWHAFPFQLRWKIYWIEDRREKKKQHTFFISFENDTVNIYDNVLLHTCGQVISLKNQSIFEMEKYPHFFIPSMLINVNAQLVLKVYILDFVFPQSGPGLWIDFEKKNGFSFAHHFKNNLLRYANKI